MGSTHHYLSLHTVFILNENIKWLEEYIVYHKHIGFEHFYLYDNEGSTGGWGNKTNNKYGFPISTTSTEEDRAKFQSLLSKYGDCITHILWQPKNQKGEIIYDQDNAVQHCMTTYGKTNEWIACMDLDEFIFSVQNINLIDYLRSLDQDLSCVKLIQKKFKDRFLTNQAYITQEYGCINMKIDESWAAKNILRCRDYLPSTNIHCIKVRNKTIIPDTNILRFNHYNLNPKQLLWMRDFFKSETEFKIDGYDDGMKRYKQLFTNVCQEDICE